MNNYDKAEEWARKAMLSNEKNFGKTHPATGMSHGNIAMTYMNRKQYDKAISGYLEAYRIYLAGFGDADSKTKLFRDNLEKAYKLENARKKIENPKPFDNWLSESMGG
jgi:tetratricopeptide (TPR) repeat protein